MFRGGRNRSRGGSTYGRGRGGNRGSSQPARLKGLFADGIWHCNCTPRLPAEHFKVKKEGKNQGRWFYTCQQSEPKRCDFFLWDEDAKPREEAAVLNNSRTEPGGKNVHGGEVQEGWNAGRQPQPQQQGEKGLFAPMSTPQKPWDEDSETLSPSPSSPFRSPSSIKRKAQDAGIDDEDEFFPWPLTGQEEADLAKAADAAEPETPHKAQKTGVYATPATTGGKRKLPWLEQPPPATPTTTTKPASGYFDTPSKPPTLQPQTAEKGVSTPAAPPTLATAKSPSPPSRYKDALLNPADSSSSLTSEALAVLANVALPPDKLSSLRGILSKHDLRTQGVTKGRDISRLALKAKDAIIAELQAKIASLEAEREVDRGVIRQLKWARAHG